MRRYQRNVMAYRPRGMVAKYAGECASCKKSIARGDAMVWAPIPRLAYCGECGQSLLYGVAREESYERYGTDVMADYR